MDKTDEKKDGIEAVLLSGFLGSGKTTLLNRMLAAEDDLSDTVVIMNEFGNVSIDGLLVDQDVNMVELVNGCICCTLQLDFRKQIEILVETVHPRRLIMEATGLADSSELIKLFAEYAEKEIFSSYRLVAVLDGQVWPMRHILGEVFTGQLVCADLILFNKVDTMDNETVETYLGEVREIYPDAVVQPTTYCGIDPEQLSPREKNTQFPSVAKKETRKIDTLFDSTMGWSSLSFIESRPMDEKKFHTFMENLEKGIFRLKGLVKFPDRSISVNCVRGVNEEKEVAPVPETKLVVIGRLVNQDKIETELTHCLA